MRCIGIVLRITPCKVPLVGVGQALLVSERLRRARGANRRITISAFVRRQSFPAPHRCRRTPSARFRPTESDRRAGRHSSRCARVRGSGGRHARPPPAGVTAIAVTSSDSMRRSRSSAGSVGIPTYTKITPDTNQTTKTAVRTMPAPPMRVDQRLAPVEKLSEVHRVGPSARERQRGQRQQRRRQAARCDQHQASRDVFS